MIKIAVLHWQIVGVDAGIVHEDTEVIGEYVGAIYTQVQKRPYAVELERINFDIPPGFSLSTHSVGALPLQQPQ